MKTRLLFALFGVLSTRAYAVFGVGDIVFDPTTHGWHLRHEAKELAQWAEQIKKYEDMILHARDLLNVQNTLKTQLGDWQGVYDRAKTIETSVEKLTNQPGANFSNLVTVDYGHDIPGRLKDPLAYTNSGNFTPIITKDGTGADVVISKESMRRYGVVENAYENFATVYKNTEPDLSAAQKELGETYADMSRPGVTQADYTKLAGKAQALQSRVSQLSQQRREASEMIAAQTALNENQGKKEALAAQRVQEANAEAFNKALSSVSYAPFKWR
jgi:hypothetical protein